ncbi:MAG TPA: SOS response-associated peptidase [Pilimelia sp.]|nr:SOS response-associated peptidase [Pilimelia sp.]
MCGRYATTRSSADLTALFEAVDDSGGGIAPAYNVAPTDPVPIVRLSRSLGSRALSIARWGLLPVWAKAPAVGSRMINARVESVATSPAYARPFVSRRCLVPADGWYEWVRRGSRRQPYFMTAADGAPLAFAGLWGPWGEGEARRLTCTVLTTAAVGDLAAVHDRMPLLLAPDRWAAWLQAPADDPALLSPPPAALVEALEIRPVGPAVGNVRNDGPGLVAPVAAPPLGSSAAPPLTLF